MTHQSRVDRIASGAIRLRGTELRQKGDLPGLIALCDKHMDDIWDDAATLNEFGHVLLYHHHPRPALPLIRRAAELEPDNLLFTHNLSCVLMATGCPEDSVAVFTRTTTPWTAAAAPRDLMHEYISLSQGYDDNEIHNFFSTRLLEAHAEAAPGRRLGRVLELGCGTGLLGSKIPASATSLWGIDLSPHMLAAAKERGVYDRLSLGDMPLVMDGIEETFDSILSSAVLCYIPDLQPVFFQVARHLAPGGMFIFSVDPCTDQWEIRVSSPGEYCHSRRYLRRLAADNGLEERSILIDRHRGPPGFWCAFRKP